MVDVDKKMSEYIHLSKYARWIPKEKRREKDWSASVDRLCDWWSYREKIQWTEGMLNDLNMVRDAIKRKDVMPSMRSLMTAGKALDRDNAAGFNCAFVAIDHPRVIDEIFYLLMCGTGVGFSVERQYINRMPHLPEEMHPTDTIIKVRDSKIGWAKALKELIAMLYSGDVPSWDLSAIRPAGARLKTFGGRASGPAPLNELMEYTVHLFKQAVSRDKEKLNSLELHDLICKVADTVIVGSVRRSACISLSNLTDSRMARAKRGEFYLTNPERSLANNSVAYTEKPDLESYMKEMRNLFESRSGERGIINKEALRRKAESCGREYDGDYGLNPCGEAILRDSGGLCNLTEVVIQPDDRMEDLEAKVKYAAILGTLQSTLVDFRYLRKVWTDNQKEERLLGISLTGIMDHPVLSGQVAPDMHDHSFRGHCSLGELLKDLKGVARRTNEEWAGSLGIPPSKQLTLVKPSGTVSKLVGVSPGIHPRFAPYYFQRLTQDAKDPLTQLMIDQKVPHVKRRDKVIFTFPIKSPSTSICAKDMGAMDQLELWKVYQEDWCEGNPSQTIYYTDKDFLKVQAWVYDNWDIVGGLSFFPYDDFIYDKEAQPYLEITKEEYEDALSDFPDIDWSRLVDYEDEDNTGIDQEFACQGGQCDV